MSFAGEIVVCPCQHLARPGSSLFLFGKSDMSRRLKYHGTTVVFPSHQVLTESLPYMAAMTGGVWHSLVVTRSFLPPQFLERWKWLPVKELRLALKWAEDRNVDALLAETSLSRYDWVVLADYWLASGLSLALVVTPPPPTSPPPPVVSYRWPWCEVLACVIMSSVFVWAIVNIVSAPSPVVTPAAVPAAPAATLLVGEIIRARGVHLTVGMLGGIIQWPTGECATIIAIEGHDRLRVYPPQDTAADGDGSYDIYYREDGPVQCVLVDEHGKRTMTMFGGLRDCAVRLDINRYGQVTGSRCDGVTSLSLVH